MNEQPRLNRTVRGRGVAKAAQLLCLRSYCSVPFYTRWPAHASGPSKRPCRGSLRCRSRAATIGLQALITPPRVVVLVDPHATNDRGPDGSVQDSWPLRVRPGTSFQNHSCVEITDQGEVPTRPGDLHAQRCRTSSTYCIGRGSWHRRPGAWRHRQGCRQSSAYLCRPQMKSD
jgi:hypothetical protein